MEGVIFKSTRHECSVFVNLRPLLLRIRSRHRGGRRRGMGTQRREEKGVGGRGRGWQDTQRREERGMIGHTYL